MTDTLLKEDHIVDPNKNYLEELVGEDKKFKTVQDLARGKYEADSYIPVLEKRLDDLRAMYTELQDQSAAKARLEDLINKLEQKPLPGEQPPAKEVRMPEKPVLDESLIDQRIAKYEQSKSESQNFSHVKNKLIERFGPNYQTMVKQQIEDLGISEEDLNTLARKSPKLALSALKIDEPRRADPFQAPPKSNTAFKPQGEKKKDWAYYQDLKKANPKLYLDPKTAVEIHNQVIAMGEEAFYGPDDNYKH